jgi:hypothetical protein
LVFAGGLRSSFFIAGFGPYRVQRHNVLKDNGLDGIEGPLPGARLTRLARAMVTCESARAPMLARIGSAAAFGVDAFFLASAGPGLRTSASLMPE